MEKRSEIERGRQEHGEPGSKDDDPYVLSRIEDYSFWSAAAFKMQKYAILWVPTLWLGTALGFGVWTPNQKAGEIKTSISEVRETSERNRQLLQLEIDSLRFTNLQLQTTLNKVLEAMKVQQRLSCADTRISARDKVIAGLECY